MRACGREIRVSKGMVRVAHLDADMYQFLESPDPLIEVLRSSDSRPDLFTFTQTILETKPKYSYPMEWENLAVLPVTTFDDWWELVGKKTRNKVRLPEKKGVQIREVPFDDNLVRGIS